MILLATVGADVEATKERETFLYITTSPPGAEVLVDGKRLGTTPGLFPFKPGIGRVIVELDGHDQHGEDITVRAGDIKRLRLRLKRRAEPKVDLPALSPDATLDSILARLNKPPNGWKVIESKSESADRLLESSEELGGRVEHVAMIGLSNRGKRIVVGVYESASSEDLAGIRDKALRATVGLSRHIGHKPHPLACLTYGNTILTFFAADEVAPEFLGEALRELGFAEKSQVPLWADLLKQHEMRKQNRVTLVVGKERMSLEGKPTSWEELRNILEELPNRANTVLCIARTTDDWGISAWHEAEDRIVWFGRDLGFESTSFIGVHPLDSRWTLSLRLVIAGEEDMTFEGRKVKESELFDELLSISERYRTVLEIVRASGGSKEMTIQQWNNLQGHATTIANQLGFKGTTDIGERPLGSKASTNQANSDAINGSRDGITAGKTSPAKESQATFGPVVQRVFTPENRRLGMFVDLESGKTFQRPEEVTEDSSGEKMIAWAKEKKIDINVNVRPGPICFLGSLDSYFWRRDDTSWQETTADDVLTDRELQDGALGYGSIFKRPDELPAVYMFKTRECGGGLLEIVEFDESAEDAIGVKIRFKLVQLPEGLPEVTVIGTGESTPSSQSKVNRALENPGTRTNADTTSPVPPPTGAASNAVPPPNPPPTAQLPP